MIYPKCVYCHSVLSHKQIIYDTQIKQICSNPKLSHDEKEKQCKDVLLELTKDNLYCCRISLKTGYRKSVHIL